MFMFIIIIIINMNIIIIIIMMIIIIIFIIIIIIIIIRSRCSSLAPFTWRPARRRLSGGRTVATATATPEESHVTTVHRRPSTKSYYKHFRPYIRITDLYHIYIYIYMI